MILDSSAVLNTVNKVVDWQIEHYSDMNKNRIYKSFGDLSWENGVFLSALSEWAEFRNDSSLISWYRNICERNRYSLSTANHRIYHADDLAVCLMYATLYDKTGKDEVIHHTLSRLEFIMNHPSKAVFGEKSKHVNDRWCWCDALYMAPPVFARFANITGNNKMRDFMDKEFWDTHKFLYDESESLFFRDAKYFKRTEKNGEKVFWGRGNAWVLAGLSRIITYLPSDYPSRMPQALRPCPGCTAAWPQVRHPDAATIRSRSVTGALPAQTPALRPAPAAEPSPRCGPHCAAPDR